MVFPLFFICEIWIYRFILICYDMLWLIWCATIFIGESPNLSCLNGLNHHVFFSFSNFYTMFFCGWIEQFVLVCPGQTTFLREIFQRPPGRHQGSVLVTQQGIRARSVLGRPPMENFSRIFRQISDYHPTDVDFKNHPQFGKWSDKSSLFGVC